MIASWPGTIPAGRVSNHPWAHWDLMPTVGEIAGANVPAGIDGMSMARALRGTSQPAHEFLYWEFHSQGSAQAVRMGRWKGIRNKARASPDGPVELYDLEADPSETTDVSSQHPDIVRRIAEIMRTARTRSHYEKWNF
jgi:arylsulfatase A-like enzyme